MLLKPTSRAKYYYEYDICHVHLSILPKRKPSKNFYVFKLKFKSNEKDIFFVVHFMYMYSLGFYLYSYYLAKPNFQSFNNKITITATLKKLAIYIMQQKKMALL